MLPAMLVACAGLGSASVPAEVRRQQVIVEALLVRQGFTCVDNTADVPVENVQIFDAVIPPGDLPTIRKCQFELPALGYRYDSKNRTITFLFSVGHVSSSLPSINPRGRLAGLQEGDRLWANESFTNLKDPTFKQLPSNKSLQRTRGGGLGHN